MGKSLDTAGGAREHILAVAQEFAQTKGLNAFSYRDLAERVGMRTASIHYYFPKKEDLSKALIEDYRHNFKLARAEIDAASQDPKERLERYVSMCLGSLEGGLRVCLCGMFATDYLTLSEPTQSELRAFIAENERWLEDALHEGHGSGRLILHDSAKKGAQTLFALIEGFIIVAHCFTDQKARLEDSKKRMFSMIASGL